MLRRAIATLLLLVGTALPIHADITVGGGSPGAPPPTTTVAGLPTCDNANQGARRTVTDAGSATGCTAGAAFRNVCRCDDGVWEFEGPGTVSAGDKGDITVGGTWEIDASAVGANELAANACTEPKLDLIDSPADEESLTYETTGGRFEWEPRVSGATTNGGLVTAGAAGAPTLGLISCSSGQIVKFNGTAWACAADDNSGVGGGDDVTVDGGATTNPNFQDSGDINFTYAAPNISATLVTDSVAAAEIAAGAVGASELASDAVTEPKLDVLDAPADEEFLTYESTGGRLEWQPASNSIVVDGGAVTNPTLADTADLNFAASGSNITATVRPDTVALGTDTTGNYVSGATAVGNNLGLVETGSGDARTLSINITGSLPTNGQVLGWDNTALAGKWQPPDSAIFAPFAPPIAPTTHLSGIAAFPMLKSLGTWALFDRYENNSIVDRVQNLLASETVDYATYKASCESDSNSAAPNDYALYVTDSNGTCSGTGSFPQACSCGLLDGTRTGLLPWPSMRKLWVHTADNYGVDVPDLYNHTVVDWQDPWVKVPATGVGNCTTISNVWANGYRMGVPVNPGTAILSIMQFGLHDGAGILSHQQESATQATTMFIGWRKASTTTPFAVDHVIDATGDTPSAVLLPAAIGDGFGVLWFRDVFYQVWVRLGVANIKKLYDLSSHSLSYHAASVSGFQQKRQVLSAALYNSWLGAGSGSTADNAYMHGASQTGMSPASGQFAWNAEDEVPTAGAAQADRDLIPVVSVCNQTGRTIANLPACTANYTNVALRVTDGDNASDCTSGGTSDVHMCTCNGSVWSATGTASDAVGYWSRHSAYQGYIGN